MYHRYPVLRQPLKKTVLAEELFPQERVVHDYFCFRAQVCAYTDSYLGTPCAVVLTYAVVFGNGLLC